MSHPLDPLLKPRSVAVIGATERPHSVGRRIVHNLQAGGFEGAIYPVNPGRDSVLGLRCYPDLAALPETAEHVAFAVSDARVEAALAEAITHGAKAATIMSQLILDSDGDPPLLRRIERMIRDSGLLVCGANGMGFYNCREGVWMCGFDTRENHPRGGNVTLISQSGAGMSGIFDCEERLDFNLAVSTGQEINVGMHDYMDYAIEVHGTRVIGLFMETVRDPAAMVAVLAKACDRAIPVVAIKVGRTELSARLAQSHSGAVAGVDAAYQALFDRYGVQRVGDMDAFATALIMFAQPCPVSAGGLVAIHDSGGERQLLIDLAHEMGVPLPAMSEPTVARLEALLDPGLPAVNPLDAWGTGGADSNDIMADCLAAMLQDPAAAVGAVVHDRAPYGAIYPEYADYMRRAQAAVVKPVFLVSNRQGTGADPAVVELTREGLPVLDGLRSFLEGANCLFAYRDFLQRPQASPPPVGEGLVAAVREALGAGEPDERAALDLLRSAGLPVVRAEAAGDEDTLLAAARDIGFPVVLKTARGDIRHKTEHGGVALDLHGEAELLAAYRAMRERLGPAVLVSPMAPRDGLEMLLGMTRDPQFGPLVVMGIGGVRVEAIRDVVSVLPPFDEATAMRLLQGLEHSALLRYRRGEGPPDIAGYCRAAALFSVLVASLADVVEEMDMNPVIVHAGGCVAVDALIVTRGGTGTEH